VHLSGEAFFKVNPGSTFKVITDYGTVTVLGTSFNVVARPGRFEVSCYTGKVLVENKSNDKAEIKPGEKVFNENEKLDKDLFVPLEAPDWTSGKFSFTDLPLEAVVAEFERQFGVEVDLATGLENLRYTGVFEKGDQEKALYMITWPLHLKSETKGNRISITR
jgi:ferric-dicitrate binding protein FerR (iron transport regulator)